MRVRSRALPLAAAALAAVPHAAMAGPQCTGQALNEFGRCQDDCNYNCREGMFSGANQCDVLIPVSNLGENQLPALGAYKMKCDRATECKLLQSEIAANEGAPNALLRCRHVQAHAAPFLLLSQLLNCRRCKISVLPYGSGAEQLPGDLPEGISVQHVRIGVRPGLPVLLERVRRLGANQPDNDGSRHRG